MDGDSGAPTGATLTAIGGVALAVGSLLTWAKVSLDLKAFADALGVDQSALAGAVGQSTKSFAGTSSNDGKIALACGVVAIVVAVAAYMKRELWMTLGVLAVVAGLVGGGLALYDIGRKGSVIADAKKTIAPSLTAAGIDPGILDNVFKVTLGIGIFLCAAGGVIAILGGAMLLMKRSAAQPAMAGMPGGGVPPPMSDSGFGTSTVAGSMAAPASPPPPPMDAPPMSEPAPPPAADPAPPATDTTGGDAGGTTTS